MLDEATPAPEPEREAHMPPRADLHDALGWIALGIAVLVGSLIMDRLEQQHINPYTVPGLLPGLLGLAMILLGGVLWVRSWRRGAHEQPFQWANAMQREQRLRVWVVTSASPETVATTAGLPPS